MEHERQHGGGDRRAKDAVDAEEDRRGVRRLERQELASRSNAMAAYMDGGSTLHGAPANPQSLREHQRQRLCTMLNLNTPVAAGAPSSKTEAGGGVGTAVDGAAVADIAVAVTDPVWKVLIYDQTGQAIISPILKVSELREQGVTVHMQLFGDRQPIPEVPAIYFIQPTRDNIKRIAADFRNNMYDAYYFNFTSTISRELLEEIAAAAVEFGAAGKVAKLYDQYLDFVCNDANFFSLRMPDSFQAFNSPKVDEAQIQALVDRAATSIYSVLVTLKCIPIIRCHKGGPAEAIGRELESRLRDQILNSRSSLFSKDDDNVWENSKPVLILFDRNLDFVSMLCHTWTYAPLVQDVFDMKQSRIQLVEEENGKTITKSVDIDQNDFFWKRNMLKAFPQVAEDVDMEINKYKVDVDRITKSSGVDSLDDINPAAPSALGLSSAIKQLPMLTDRKRTLDIHMSIATNLLRVIQQRRLDEFFANEENITKLSKASMMQELKDPNKSPQDKVRFFAVFFLSTKTEMPKEEFNDYIAALEAAGAGAEVGGLKYLVQIRAFSRMSSMAMLDDQAPQGGNARDGVAFLGKFTSKITDSLKDAGVHNHFESLLSGVKNLLPSQKEYPVTKLLGQIMEKGDQPPSAREANITGGNNGNAADEYLWLDPYLNKSTKSYKNTSAPPGLGDGSSFTEAIVFAVGGGNYLEYQNLIEYMNHHDGFLGAKRRIIYGSTELVSPQGFFNQLKALGPQPVVQPPKVDIL